MMLLYILRPVLDCEMMPGQSGPAKIAFRPTSAAIMTLPEAAKLAAIEGGHRFRWLTARAASGQYLREPGLPTWCGNLISSMASSLLVPGSELSDTAAASAARKAGVATIGVLCGGFTEASLREAGCTDVVPGPATLFARFEKSLLAR
jgi:hypothetical protein